jgi:hypothetical protein
VAGPAALVLRDLAATDRPSPVAADLDALPEEAPELTVAPVLGVARPPAVESVDVAVDAAVTADSMLSVLTATEQDERSALRRVASLVVLLTLTLVTAGLVGAGIYQAVAGLG